MKAYRWSPRLLVLALVIPNIMPALAQAPAKKRGPTSAEFVKTGLYVIREGGGNSLLRLTGEGPVVIDSGLPGKYQAVAHEAQEISELPVKVVINTGGHARETGNNAEFRKAGAQVLAQKSAAALMVSPPSKTYTDEFLLRLGGVEMNVLHTASARSNGDSVVYFPYLRVVAVGDLFTSAPDPDYSAGGSLAGWAPALTRILKLDFDLAVPGTGPVVTRGDLEKLRDQLSALVVKAGALVKSGATEDSLSGQLKSGDLGMTLNLSKDQLHGFYSELEINP